MTIHERLRSARQDAGYASAAAAAKAFGWPIGTYSCHENGSRGIKLDVMERYARAFEVDPLWLLHGDIDELFAKRFAKHINEVVQRMQPELEEMHAQTTLLETIRNEIEAGRLSRFNMWGETIEAITQQLFGPGEAALAPDAENRNVSAQAHRAKIVALASVVGGGADAVSEKVVGYVWFGREWLKSRGIDAANCAVIGVRGAPTWPKLPDGYSILVDRSRTEGIPGEDFVYRTQNGLVIKSVIASPDGEGWLLREVFASEPEPYLGDADNCGLIVWAGRVIVETDKN